MPVSRGRLPTPHRALGWTLALIAMVVCTSPTFAQIAPDPDAEATLRFGPLAMKSTIALSNLGSDSNVFNESDLG